MIYDYENPVQVFRLYNIPSSQRPINNGSDTSINATLFCLVTDSDGSGLVCSQQQSKSLLRVKLLTFHNGVWLLIVDEPSVAAILDDFNIVFFSISPPVPHLATSQEEMYKY